HPQYIANELENAEFQMTQRIPVSFFRVGALKQNLSADLLAQMDNFMQKTGWLISPSIFTVNSAVGQHANNLNLANDAIFASPNTGGELRRDGNLLIDDEGSRWEIRDGIYDFKDT